MPTTATKPTEDEINRLEKAAWDAHVDQVLVWYRDQRDEGLRIAKQATNGWACYAKRQVEHDEIARLHTVIATLDGPAGGAPAAVDERSTERATAESTGLRTRPQSAWEREAKQLQWALDNVYTLARRELRRLGRAGVTESVSGDRWGHVLRLCEDSGCKGRGVLRDNGGAVNADTERA